MKTPSPTYNFLFQCWICTYSSSSPYKLIDHIRVEHALHPHSAGSKKKRNYEQKKKRNMQLKLGAIKKKSMYNNALLEVNIPYPESQTQCMFAALDLARSQIRSQVMSYWGDHASFRWQISLDIEMVRENAENDSVLVDRGYFTSNMNTMLNPSEFSSSYDTIINQLWQRQIAFQRNGSGWTVKRIHSINVFLYDFVPFTGSSFIKTPQALSRSKAIINVENRNDLFCFKYAIAGIFSDQIENQQKKIKPSAYKPFLHHFNWKGLNFHKGINFTSDLDKFEKNNPNISLNVLLTLANRKSLRGEKQLFPLRLAKESKEICINLLFIYSEEFEYGHWCFIKDLDLLCARSQNRGKTCLRCITNFTGKNAQRNYNAHLADCEKNDPLAIKFPQDEKIYFKNHKNSLRVPFVIYCDFESILSEKRIVNFMEKKLENNTKQNNKIDIRNLIKEEEEEEEEEDVPPPEKRSKFEETIQHERKLSLKLS